MTARPSFSAKRPISAIFIGETSDTLASAIRSGQLPSPPHTNSAGSTSDNSSAADGSSVREDQIGKNRNMHNGSYRGTNGERPRSRSRSYDIDEDEDEDDHDLHMNDDGEDHTAKLSDDKRLTTSNERSGSLSRAPSVTRDGDINRARSLADRNRQVLEKLSTISSGSHLSTPSPTDRNRAPSRTQTSPLPRISTAGPSRISFTRSRHEVDIPSGSETERGPLHSNSSSDDLSTTPPASGVSGTFEYPPPTENKRTLQRPSSAGSPAKNTVKRLSAQQEVGPSWSNSVRRTRRATVVEGNGSNIFADAIADALGAKKSPKRAPLPNEFRADRRSLDGRSGGSISPEISTTQGRRSRPPSRAQEAQLARSTSPEYKLTSSARNSKFATVRESSSHRVHGQWSSADSTQDAEPARRYRYEGRGGSAESALGTGLRSVVSEGLRAAGLVRRRDSLPEEDAEPPNEGLLRRKSVGTGSVKWRDEEFEPRTPPNANDRLASRGIHSIISTRPATSLAAYHQDEAPRTAPTLMRHRSTFTLPAQLVLANRSPNAIRTYASPSGMIRSKALPAIPSQPSTPPAEHAKLMSDALNMFDSYLSRLPPPASSAAPDCLQSAQTMVQSLTVLNSMLRAGASGAVEEQIEAEVSPDNSTAQTQADIWRKVGTDFRESLRVSDDLVRTMTGFLLGVGRMLKESGAIVGGISQSNSPHVRGLSLDNNHTGRLSDGLGSRSSEGKRSHDGRSQDGRTTLEGRRSAEGRRSTDIRRSLDATRDDIVKRSIPTRPSTSMSVLREREHERERERELEREREREREREWDRERERAEREREEERERIQQREAELRAAAAERTQEKRPSVFTAFSSRRLFSSVRQTPVASPLSRENILPPEPTQSPSPTLERQASRARLQQPSPENSRRQPLGLPPPLPSIPSESLLRRTSKTHRPKSSGTSTATVRGSSILIPSASPSSYATAQLSPMTATVSTAPPPEAPLFRNKTTTSSTLSRARGASTISIATGRALNFNASEEREQRKRTLSATSATFDSPIMDSPTSATTITPGDSRRLRSTRSRLPIGDGLDSTIAPAGRERRRTVTELWN